MPSHRCYALPIVQPAFWHTLIPFTLPPWDRRGPLRLEHSSSEYEAYGDDAAAYRPECWLEASPERLILIEEAFHLVFGFGRIRCNR